jgi:hypothetical protein
MEIKISESTFEYSLPTYPMPIALPKVGDIVPEVTLPIITPLSFTI